MREPQNTSSTPFAIQSPPVRATGRGGTRIYELGGCTTPSRNSTNRWRLIPKTRRRWSVWARRSRPTSRSGNGRANPARDARSRQFPHGDQAPLTVNRSSRFTSPSKLASPSTFPVPQFEMTMIWSVKSTHPSTFRSGDEVVMHLRQHVSGAPMGEFEGAKKADGTVIGRWKE